MGRVVGVVALYPTSHLFMSWAIVDEMVGMQFWNIIASKVRAGERKKGFPMGRGAGWGVALYPTSHLFMSWAVVEEILGMQFCKKLPVKVRGKKKRVPYGERGGNRGVALYPTSRLFMSWGEVDKIVGMQFFKIFASKGGGKKKRFPMGRGVRRGLYTPHPTYLWAIIDKIVAWNFAK